MSDRCSPGAWSCRRSACALATALLLASGCGGGGGSSAPIGPSQEGVLAEKPGGGLYFVDRHAGGGASRLRLSEALWGRLVDVHGLDANGDVMAEPSLRELVVSESLLDQDGRWRLETNPITRITRLIVLREPGAPDLGEGTFETLVRQATAGLAGVEPRPPGASAGYSYIARNATLVLRFDDLLDDSPEAVAALDTHVRLLTGYPPVVPFQARTFFDPNHGGVAGGKFHSTRVLVDMTVSEAEAAASAVPLGINSLGLPRGDAESTAANVSLRLPSHEDSGTGQFDLLTNLAGAPLDGRACSPYDSSAPTLDVVRGLRSGSDADVNNGFLLDIEAPRLVGNWPCRVEDARPLDTGGTRWALDLRFGTLCRKVPQAGDVVAVGRHFLEVALDGTSLDGNGGVSCEAVAVGGEPPAPSDLLGQGTFQTLYVRGAGQPSGCFVRFDPPPREYPVTGVSSDAHVVLRFTEPMDPASALPFDTVMILRGTVGTEPAPTTFVVGSVQTSTDLREFSFVSSLPFAHLGDRAPYHLVAPRTDGVTDLAGNELLESIPAIEFTIDPESPSAKNGGLVLRFESTDELPAIGALDLRGQFTYDLEGGRIRPRAAGFASRAVETANPIISIMTPFPLGVQTPLAPLGSKLQTVWRYLDFGWTATDESKYNLDVVGLYWSPAQGSVVSDFFEDFEVRLSHSNRIPDEQPAAPIIGNVISPKSGLRLSDPYVENILADPLSPQKVMNVRTRGYRIEPRDLSMTTAGTPLMPWPVNRDGGELVSFTWRDNAVLALGGDEGRGVPLEIESGPPLGLGQIPASLAPAGEVPAVALPLLMEFRCYPSETALGLNPLAIALASNVTSNPNFRAYSTGGIDTTGQAVAKHPDSQPRPTGGFNPRGRPPGSPTAQPADNGVYFGQLDYVIRVSRAHTVWMDMGAAGTRFTDVVIEPAVNPEGTEVRVDFRGADGFVALGVEPFAAENLTPLGDLREGEVLFHGGDATWKSAVSGIDGARYVQARFSFLNNIDAGLAPTLSGFGLAFEIE